MYSVLTRGQSGEVLSGHVFRFSRSNFENAFWNIVDFPYTTICEIGGLG